jgi:hypothetical protein
MNRTLCLLILMLTMCASVCGAQDKTALAQILKSEKDAAQLVEDLNSYARKSPWDIEAMSTVAQRLAVQGLTASQIMRTITTSGDMAAALDYDDQKFAQIVWLTGALLKSETPGPSLYGLEGLGVPVFDLLGETIGRSADETLQLLRQDRLVSRGVFGLLTENYDRRYHGMAEKLLIKLRNAHR